ncbi:MAG TPA: hypothetical protein VMT86_17560 [Bryobacteraceae bacterium]|nr:hypothetical protein [Bryobacteraceae bacterium]
MIFKGSRYQFTSVIQVKTADGKTVSALTARFVPPTPAGFYHTFSSAERLDLMAYRYYGNPEKLWRIADANTEMDPEDLEDPGRQLLIPPDRT